jgi:hypothetical protein
MTKNKIIIISKNSENKNNSIWKNSETITKFRLDFRVFDFIQNYIYINRLFFLIKLQIFIFIIVLNYL